MMRIRLTAVPAALVLLVCALLACAGPARAQPGPGGPPAVGTVAVQKQPIIETSEFVGRIQATDKVDIVARVTAFLEERLFTEGSEVQKGDLLYKLERGPFEAELQSKLATVAQMQALLRNATIALNRVQSLLNTPAGQRSTVDDALAQQSSYAAQLQAAQAQVRSAQINLEYTEIHAPISGKIGRATVTIGNVVGPTTGALTTIVSQDPMYVVFPVSVRAELDLRKQYDSKGGFAAVALRLRLPNGQLYPQAGTLDYADPTVAPGTDTITLRGRVPNPLRPGAKLGEPGNRELVDGEFVTVLVEGVQPVLALAIPRSAVLSDQQGTYVYVVDGEKKAQQRRIQLGQSTQATAVVMAGLQEGDQVIADGIQRVRPGVVVNPAPAAPTVTAPPNPPQPAAPARN
jgi:membrane fusion protein (multidrug efflux system)